MRVCLVHYDGIYPYRMAGPAVVASNLLKAFDKNGVGVDLVLVWDGRTLKESDLGLSSNIRIHTVPYRHWDFSRSLSKCLKGSGSLIHFNMVGTRPPHPLYPLLSRLRRQPVIWTVHGYIPVELGLNRNFRAPWSWALTAEFMLLPKTVHRVVVFSRYMKQLLSRHLPENHIRTIPLGVDLGTFGHRVVSLDKGTIRMLFVGRLVPVKGVEVLLDALRIVDPSIRLETYIVGDGPLRSKIESTVRRSGLADKVTVCGSVSEETKIAYLQRSDIFVLPSIYEPIPIAILEAFATGVPVIASNVGGIPELVSDGVNGLLVSPRDPNALAAAISKLSTDAALRAELGRNARMSALRHSWLDVAKDYVSFYEEVLSECT